MVEERQEVARAKFDASHHIIEPYKVGQFVMAKEVIPGSKWKEHYVGPFQVARVGQNGTYFLRNMLQEEEKYRIPPDHLIPFKDYEFPEAQSYEIKEILDVRGTHSNYEYLVQWRDKDSENIWQPTSTFDSLATIQKFMDKHPNILPPLGKS